MPDRLVGRLACIALAALLAPRSLAAETARGSATSLMEGVAWQVALDRALFSPGVIDGQLGPKSAAAIRDFQIARGLPATAKADAATRAVLGVNPADATRRYTLTNADMAEIGPWPKSWQAKSRAKWLGYKSAAALVAERGHCSLALLARLNPGVSLDKLAAGQSLVIPNVSDAPGSDDVTRLEVNLATKTIRALGAGSRVKALFHCSIAKHKAKRPRGRCTVKVVAPDPVYVFDPKMWPEVKGVKTKLTIPPGPRNPVGRFWIGLSLPGYGIHGTPEPELIGKTGSHGCFRLANWDAVRLGQMVRPGVPVEFVTTEPARVATAARPAARPVALAKQPGTARPANLAERYPDLFERDLSPPPIAVNLPE